MRQRRKGERTMRKEQVRRPGGKRRAGDRRKENGEQARNWRGMRGCEAETETETERVAAMRKVSGYGKYDELPSTRRLNRKQPITTTSTNKSPTTRIKTEHPFGCAKLSTLETSS